MKFFNTIVLLAALCFTSCVNEPYWPGTEMENGVRYSTFDFSTTFDCDVTLNLGQRQFVYIYTEDPAENPSAEPIRSLWTDASGFFECQLTLPTYLKGGNIYALTANNKLIANVSSKGASFKDSGSNISRSGEDSLQPEKSLCCEITDSYLARIPRLSGGSPSNNLQKLVETGEIAVETKGDNTQVLFTFMHAFGWNCNYIYYYYYKGEDPVNLENRDYYINLICNDDRFLCTRGWGVQINSYNSGRPGNVNLDNITILTENGLGWINSRFSDINGKDYSTPHYDESMIGISNPLYFYGENYEKTVGEKFPKGYKIGLIMKSISNQEKNKFINYNPSTTTFESTKYVFSNPNANLSDNHGNSIHVCRFWSSNGDNISRFVYGFEDSLRGVDPNPDYNFTDFLCMISTTPSAVVDNISSLTSTYSSESGTLLFEDMYPIQGDYDMNDVIVEYRKVKEFERNSKNQDIIKNMYVELTPVHYGAQFDDYIYVQCHKKLGAKLCEPQLADFKKAFGMNLKAVCEYNEREITTKASPNLKSVRVYLIKDYIPTGSSNADNLQDGNVPNDNIDIFIYVKNTNREVHLTNKRHAGLGSLDDLTDYQKSYKAEQHINGFYPWAMKIPLKSSGNKFRGFIPVTEGVMIIYEYLGFGQWVGSNGNEAETWYLNSNYTPYTYR